MRLTNTIRDAFVRAAMQDVPEIDYDPIIRKAVTAAVVAALPEPVRKAYSNKDCSGYFETCSRRYGGVSVFVPGFFRYSEGEFPKLTDATEIELNKLGAKCEAQKKSRKELETKLLGAAYAASTHKALVDMLPEFAKYLPPDDSAANRSLPVAANIVADFVRAGWPKGKASKRAIS